MKSINKIFLLILLTIPFYQCDFFKTKADPRSHYEINFNEERANRGIPLIGENYKRRHDTPAAYQLWVNMEDTIPRHWRKYVNCDSEGYNIVAEGDDFLVKWEGEVVVLSIGYNFENEKNNLNPWAYIDISHFQAREKETGETTGSYFINDSTYKTSIEYPIGKSTDKDVYHPEIEKYFGKKLEKIKDLSLEEADRILMNNHLERKRRL